MNSFNWKRKSKLDTNSASTFLSSSSDEDEDTDIDWLHPTVKRQCLSLLEDGQAKSQRLQREGSLLAENERYWEAIKYWDEALQLTPNVAAIHEMKSQVLQELGEVFPSVQCAERAVQLEPQWAVARQTLGRAQLGLGELETACKSFQKAIHLLPTDQEMRADLKWTLEILNQKIASQTTETHNKKKK